MRSSLIPSPIVRYRVVENRNVKFSVNVSVSRHVVEVGKPFILSVSVYNPYNVIARLRILLTPSLPVIVNGRKVGKNVQYVLYSGLISPYTILNLSYNVVGTCPGTLKLVIIVEHVVESVEPVFLSYGREVLSWYSYYVVNVSAIGRRVVSIYDFDVVGTAVTVSRVVKISG